MRIRGLSALLCLSVLSLGVGGCGGQSQSEKDAAARSAAVRVERAAALKKQREARARKAQAIAAADRCSDSYGDLLEEAQELDSRLSVGLKPDAYFERVGDLKVAYDKAAANGPDDDAAAFSCIGDVGLPLEKAFNKFASAQTIWSTCIEDYACDTDSITSRLQSRWSSASRYIEKSAGALKDMADPAA